MNQDLKEWWKLLSDFDWSLVEKQLRVLNQVPWKEMRWMKFIFHLLNTIGFCDFSQCFIICFIIENTILAPLKKIPHELMSWWSLP